MRIFVTPNQFINLKNKRIYGKISPLVSLGVCVEPARIIRPQLVYQL